MHAFSNGNCSFSSFGSLTKYSPLSFFFRVCGNVCMCMGVYHSVLWLALVYPQWRARCRKGRQLLVVWDTALKGKGKLVSVCPVLDPRAYVGVGQNVIVISDSTKSPLWLEPLLHWGSPRLLQTRDGSCINCFEYCSKRLEHSSQSVFPLPVWLGVSCTNGTIVSLPLILYRVRVTYSKLLYSSFKYLWIVSHA